LKKKKKKERKKEEDEEDIKIDGRFKASNNVFISDDLLKLSK
jgi:hypothetical protein